MTKLNTLKEIWYRHLHIFFWWGEKVRTDPTDQSIC